ncbi:MAG: hypothetical protein WBC44_10590 [Planctomycetaceae bacterium]
MTRTATSSMLSPPHAEGPSDMPGLPPPVKQHGSVPDTCAARPLSLAWITDELLDVTRQVWSPLYGRELSIDEATEILINVQRFAEVLLKTRRGRETT